MLKTSRTFTDSSGKPTAEMAVKLAFHRNGYSVDFEVHGAILSDNADEFCRFVEELRDYPGQAWRLNLQNLKILSSRGFQALVKLAKAVQKRGQKVEITGIDPIVYYLMRENRLDKYFEFGRDRERLLESQKMLFDTFCMN